MKKELLGPYPALLACRFYLFRFTAIAILVLMITSCDKNILLESNASISGTQPRLAHQPLFSTSYEIEEFSATQILSQLAQDSKQKAFLQIASQPRLSRQQVEFKLFADGNYDILMTQLTPIRVDLLPSSMQRKKPESVLSYKIRVQNGIARFYDRDGNETGSSQLKLARFTSLANRIIKSSEINQEQVVNEIMGHPLINEAYVLAMAREKNAEVTEKQGITKIRFDLTRFAAESNETVENLSKYSVQYYDFKNKRLLGEQLYHKDGKTLLYRCEIFYSPLAGDNQIEKTLSESFDEDPKSGVKTRHMQQTFYSNVKTEIYNRSLINNGHKD